MNRTWSLALERPSNSSPFGLTINLSHYISFNSHLQNLVSLNWTWEQHNNSKKQTLFLSLLGHLINLFTIFIRIGNVKLCSLGRETCSRQNFSSWTWRWVLRTKNVVLSRLPERCWGTLENRLAILGYHVPEIVLAKHILWPLYLSLFLVT